MAVLYVMEPGAQVQKTYGRLRVMKEGKVLQELRLPDIERVALFGGVQLTSQAAAFLMEAGIETAFLSSRGIYRGRLAPASLRGVSLRLFQYRAFADMPTRLGMAQGIVRGKIRNGETILAQYQRNHPEFNATREREQMARCRLAVGKSEDLNALLGQEGQAASSYFAAFGRMFRHTFQFSVRSRRPPRDPANALLSFGYALLCAETAGAVATTGLDLTLGMLHAPDEGRPSLGLDLAEEFRQPLIDRLVLHLANNRVLELDDFEGDPTKGWLLRPAPRKRFLEIYEERMTTPFQPREATKPLTPRQLVRDQAQALATAFRTGTAYTPFVLR